MKFKTNWSPLEVAKYYGFPLHRKGNGQSIGIISLGGEVDMSELKSDFDAMGIPFPEIVTKTISPKKISAEQNRQPSYETHIDVEIIGSICPEAKITVYRGSNPSGFSQCVERAIQDRNSVISISWGYREEARDKSSKMEKLLRQAKSKRITVCAATGDGGSSGMNDNTGKAIKAEDGKAHVNYPASSPHVLACGGTAIDLVKGIMKETVWNDSETNGAATGGGVSEIFPLPQWQKQKGINIPSINSGRIGRVLPDVSGLAARGDWKIYWKGDGKPTGGTSGVAPLWAAFIVLVNEERKLKGKKPIGFVNKIFYELSASKGYFNEITGGDNLIVKDYPGYIADKKFNACCGLGTPIAKRLFDTLVKVN